MNNSKSLTSSRGQMFVNGYRIYKNPNEKCWHVEKDGKEVNKFNTRTEAHQWALSQNSITVSSSLKSNSKRGGEASKTDRHSQRNTPKTVQSKKKDNKKN